ncbi:sialic acid-binding Ig-like lectin 5 isoform X1 [Coregonus clupeaformis]|uniref:sialic acid-binding Ig-like lectin 5 isoform X1 n=2 Tax=Coregonus clupeaformis TaxID=59861 RepID=UPI001BDFE347|nr:sialic acid-binding Ig-like lectin 5 isoform X1 [Coregonus clupeaformis]
MGCVVILITLVIMLFYTLSVLNPVDTDKVTRERGERGQTLVLWLIHRGSGGRMWVFMWAALLFSLTERARCQQQPQPPPHTKASPWTITFSPAEITAEKGLCAVISCTFTHPDNAKPTTAIWFKCSTYGECVQDKNRIFHSKNPSKAQEGYKQRVSLLETDLTKKNCSVIINDIRENDTGAYQFRMIGGPFTFTYPQKMKITVTALTQKPSVLTPTLTEGEPATLTCTAPGMCSGTPPHITWAWRGTGDNITELQENTAIQEREDLASVTTTHFSNLTFTPSAKDHSTNVTCLVTFNGIVTTKKTLKLNVTHVKEPKISGCNTVREGDTLNLTCSVDSYPPSSSNITWSKKGKTAFDQNSSGLATLTISNMTREHAGEYVCTAQHPNRTLTASAVVTVMYRPVMLNGSGCVVQAEVMTCVCVSLGVPLPLIEWPLLELNTEKYSLTTSVFGSSVNSTISLPVRNHTHNTTVECVSRNTVGVVRGKLQETQKENQEKQGDEVLEDILAMLSNPKLITAFVIGASFTAIIACIVLCLKGTFQRQKERIPKDSDSKSPFMNLEMVACEDQQTDTGQAVGGEQTPLQVELREGAENGGPHTSGATGKSATGEEPKEVDYASIDYSLLKKKTPEEAEKKTTTTESEYAKIKREKKKDGEEDEGEGSGVMEEEEKENSKPAAETDEDTALYSNVKAIMGGWNSIQ